VRLIDIVFRQGHLSEQALIEAIAGGQRPPHLDRCDLCAERALAISRWMDEVQLDATETADAVFTPNISRRSSPRFFVVWSRSTVRPSHRLPCREPNWPRGG
jgi:hypothetical protein